MKLAISRPILVLSFALMLVFFGVNALKNLSVSLYPNVDVPIITITTIYKGANAEIVESKVTEKIEEAISGIDELKKITSTSSDNVSIVVAEFELTKEIEIAANDVRDKISRLSLDNDIDSPIVEKYNVGGAPVISLFISPKHKITNTKELLALNTYADLNIKPLLQRIKGVGSVNMVGFLEREIKIKPNNNALSKYNLTYTDIAQAINAQNIQLDGGKIISKDKEWKILSKSDKDKVEELANIVVANGIKLGDIAVILDSTKERRSFSNLANSEIQSEGILLELQKISGANEIEIKKGLLEILPFLRSISNDYDLTILRDTTNYIQDTIYSVAFDLLLGAFLAVLIVFVFLRNLSVTLIAALSLPISIMGAFACLYFFGMTLNLATMIAITLAIGIIIDDAIVVIENIYKKIEKGMERREAAYEGVRQISFALIAISCMLLSVFIPIANMSGVTGRFFVSFGLSLSASIIISYFVVISLIPMLSARIITTQKSRFYANTEKYFTNIEEFYSRILQVVLRNNWRVILLVFLAFVSSLLLISRLGVEFLPSEDKAEFDIRLVSKPGISIEKMQEESLEIQAYLDRLPEVEYSILNIGFTQERKVYEGKIYVKLTPYNKRDRGLQEIMESLREVYKPYSSKLDMDITLIEIPQISLGEDDSPFQMALYSFSDEKLQESLKRLESLMQSSGKYSDIHTDIKPKTPQIRLDIKQSVANEYGFSAKEIALAVSNAFSGEYAISYFKENGKEYDIVLLSTQKTNINDIRRLILRNKRGDIVFLEGLVDVQEIDSITSIKHYDRQKSVMVYSNLGNGISLGEATSYVENNTDSWLLDGVRYKIEGYAKYMQETNEAFIVAMSMAFILIYLILAALYESLLQPLIIITTLPLSFSGAFFALFISGESISLFSVMGLMLLMGLVGKNATLIIDVANEKIESGIEIAQAICEAGKERLRPILMTTIAMVFGMLPLALASGAGSGIKSPMGIAMIGGLVFSMILSLLIVPALFGVSYNLDRKLRNWYK